MERLGSFNMMTREVKGETMLCVCDCICSVKHVIMISSNLRIHLCAKTNVWENRGASIRQSTNKGPRGYLGEILGGLGAEQSKWGGGVRGGIVPQIRSFFLTLFKRGVGGQTHVQKFWSKFCMISKAFWQHKIDIKRLVYVDFRVYLTWFPQIYVYIVQS